MTHRLRGQILKRLEGGEVRGTYGSIIRQLKLGHCNAAQLRKAVDQLVMRRRIQRQRSKRFPRQVTLSLRKSRK
jgi:hypothetical protein